MYIDAKLEIKIHFTFTSLYNDIISYCYLDMLSWSLLSLLLL